jgi:hypothetical protein
MDAEAQDADGVRVTELMDLTPTIERVRPRRSWWAPLTIAAFTAITGLGLAASSLIPRLTDRASERRDVAAPRGTSVSTAEQPGLAASRADVAAAVRLVTSDAGSLRAVVTGAATSDVSRVDVDIRIAGHVIGSGVVYPGRDRDDGRPAGTSESVGLAGIVPWSMVIDIRSAPEDAIAVATVSWRSSTAVDDSRDIVIALGDGRGGTR